MKPDTSIERNAHTPFAKYMKITNNNVIYKLAYWWCDEDKKPTEPNLCDMLGQATKTVLLSPALLCLFILISPFFLVEWIGATKFAKWLEAKKKALNDGFEASALYKSFAAFKSKVCPKVTVVNKPDSLGSNANLNHGGE